jgi:phage terminase large subunit
VERLPRRGQDRFFSIDDAIAMRQRVSRECWETEILCHRPSTRQVVFPSFDVALHVRQTPPPGPSRQWLGIDFGFSNPFVCLWIQAIEPDQTFVLDEYVQPGRTIDQHIAHIKASPHHQADRIACDPAGNGANDQTAWSNIQRLRQAGFIVKSRASRIVDGIELIRAALCSASDTRRLWIHPRCKRLIKAMQAYRYPDAPGETPLKDNEHDHLIDALRYFYINRQGGSLHVRAY